MEQEEPSYVYPYRAYGHMAHCEPRYRVHDDSSVSEPSRRHRLGEPVPAQNHPDRLRTTPERHHSASIMLRTLRLETPQRSHGAKTNIGTAWHSCLRHAGTRLKLIRNLRPPHALEFHWRYKHGAVAAAREHQVVAPHGVLVQRRSRQIQVDHQLRFRSPLQADCALATLQAVDQARAPEAPSAVNPTLRPGSRSPPSGCEGARRPRRTQKDTFPHRRSRLLRPPRHRLPHA